MKRLMLCMALCVSSVAFAQEEQESFTTTIRGNQELPSILTIVPWASPPGPGQVDPLVPHSGNVFQRSFSTVERIEVQRQLLFMDKDSQ